MPACHKALSVPRSKTSPAPAPGWQTAPGSEAQVLPRFSQPVHPEPSKPSRISAEPVPSANTSRCPGAQEDVLHGAACHACLFVPETSCERGNRYLERGALCSTLAGAGIEFLEA